MEESKLYTWFLGNGGAWKDLNIYRSQNQQQEAISGRGHLVQKKAVFAMANMVYVDHIQFTKVWLGVVLIPLAFVLCLVLIIYAKFVAQILPSILCH